MLVNIQFITSNATNLKELQLYLKLRFQADGSAGYFDIDTLTKNERYYLLPKLIERGWIDKEKNKIISHRKICIQNNHVGIFADIDKDTVHDTNKLKGFIIGSLEASQLRSHHNRQKGTAKAIDPVLNQKIHNPFNVGKNNLGYFTKVKKISGSDQYLGRVFNSSISKLTGLSTSSISLWRKHSVNNYRLSKITSEHHEVMGRSSQDKKSFKDKHGMFVTYDLTILTNLTTFSYKHYSPFLRSKIKNSCSSSPTLPSSLSITNTINRRAISMGEIYGVKDFGDFPFPTSITR